MEQKIKIGYKLLGSYENFAFRELKQVDPCEVFLFNKNIFDAFNYHTELEQKTFVAREVAYLSKKLNGVVCVFCQSVFNSKVHESVLICDRGAFLGVSDAIFGAEESGKTLNLYETSAGRIALIVGEDSDIFEIYTLASLYEADLAFTFCDKAGSRVSSCIKLAASVSNNLPIVAMHTKQIKAFLPNGSVKTYEKNKKHFTITPQKEQKNAIDRTDLFKSIYTKTAL